MAETDVAICKTTIRLNEFDGVKGVYIMRHMVTGLNKVGRTELLDKRYRDLVSMINPHLLLAFFPTQEYGKVEKMFHRQHRKQRHENEYFDLDVNYIYNWMLSLGLENLIIPTIEECLFQQIRANWIIARTEGRKVSFNVYFRNIIGHVG